MLNGILFYLRKLLLNDIFLNSLLLWFCFQKSPFLLHWTVSAYHLYFCFGPILSCHLCLHSHYSLFFLLSFHMSHSGVSVRFILFWVSYIFGFPFWNDFVICFYFPELCQFLLHSLFLSFADLWLSF